MILEKLKLDISNMDKNHSQLRKVLTNILFLLLLFPLALVVNAEDSEFDHDKTGFELVGPHERISCDSCHIRGIFKGIPKRCESCHDIGSLIATSIKPANHIITRGSCEGCHAGNTWAVTGFDHDSISSSCINCHNGATATGKPVNHVQSSQLCDDCHSTISWIPAIFNHNSITGSCESCHNGTTARGKSGSHFVTSSPCDTCHSPSRRDWSSIFRHASLDYPNHGRNFDCKTCHKSNNTSVTWNATYSPNCAACHENDYEAGEHKKSEVPSVENYTVGDLQNCSGACHFYENGTIKKSRSGEHRATDGDF